MGDQAAHLASIERQTGRRLEQVDLEPEPPEALAYVWELYCELLPRHTSSGFGLNPLMPGDVESWARLTRRELKPFEVQLLFGLDQVFIMSLNRKRT